MIRSNDFFSKTKPKLSIRLGCLVVCVILCFIGFFMKGLILGEKPKIFDIFSYIGTFTTLIGLIVAICEILRSMSLSEELKSRIDSITDLEIERIFSSIQENLNLAITSLENENYTESLIYFRVFREGCSFINIYDSNFQSIESSLSSIYKTKSKFDTPKKRSLINSLLTIKKQVEGFAINVRPEITQRLREKSVDTSRHN